MKKQISLLLTLCLTLSLAGCFRPKEESPAPSETVATGANNVTEPTTPATPVSDETMIAISVPAVTENTTAADGTVIFQYTYQNPSLVLHKPEVADKIILDLINRMDATRTDAKSVADAAKSAYNGSAGWMAYLYRLEYSPTRMDSSVLSFAGTNEVYNGGPHPNRTCVSASYDLSTGDVLTLASIMTKDGKVEDLCQLILEGLSGRAEGDYLYENYAQTVKQ